MWEDIQKTLEKYLRVQNDKKKKMDDHRNLTKYRRRLDRVVKHEIRCERQLNQKINVTNSTNLGYIHSHEKYELPQPITKRKLEGKSGIGEKKLSRFRNMREWTGLNIEQVFGTGKDRDDYAGSHRQPALRTVLTDIVCLHKLPHETFLFSKIICAVCSALVQCVHSISHQS